MVKDRNPIVNPIVAIVNTNHYFGQQYLLTLEAGVGLMPLDSVLSFGANLRTVDRGKLTHCTVVQHSSSPEQAMQACCIPWLGKITFRVH